MYFLNSINFLSLGQDFGKREGASRDEIRTGKKFFLLQESKTPFMLVRTCRVYKNKYL